MPITMFRRMNSLEKRRQSLLTEISVCLSALVPLGAEYLSVCGIKDVLLFLFKTLVEKRSILLFFSRFYFSQSSNSYDGESL